MTDTYDGPVCTERSTAGDWCGECDACLLAMAWIEKILTEEKS